MTTSEDKPQSSTCRYFCSLVIAIGLDAAYWIQLNKTDPAECKDTAYHWTVFSKWYLFAYSITFAIVTLLSIIWRDDMTGCKKLIVSLLICPHGVCFIVHIVSSCITFHYRDQCLPLNGLFVASFVISVLGLTSPFIVCCCVCVAGITIKLASAIKEAEEERSDHNNKKRAVSDNNKAKTNVSSRIKNHDNAVHTIPDGLKLEELARIISNAADLEQNGLVTSKPAK